MRIGLQVPDFRWPGGTATIGADLATIARTADDVGFEHLAVMDHFFQIGVVGPVEDPMLEVGGPFLRQEEPARLLLVIGMQLPAQLVPVVHGRKFIPVTSRLAGQSKIGLIGMLGGVLRLADLRLIGTLQIFGSLFGAMELLGRDRVLARIDAALRKLSATEVPAP